jgi:hypothetical protein
MKIDYIKLKKPFVRWLPWFRWKPNLHEIELEITTFCNLRCYNCDRSSRQAPSNESMSISQVEQFVNESIDLNWKWKQISLLGGEPTLHPQITEILKIIKRYLDFYPGCKIEIATNGCGPKVKKIVSKLPTWIFVRSTDKNSISHDFCSYNLAPIDFEKYKQADFSKGCWITTACGLGLTKYGYYSCGAGASVDRVFGFDIGLKSLKQLSHQKLRKQMIQLCSYCGHYKKNHNTKRIKHEEISESWEKAYLEFKKEKPQLTKF